MVANYQCSKCSTIFTNKKKFMNHIRRKTPCGVINSVEVFHDEIERINAMFDEVDEHGIDDKRLKYLTNKYFDVVNIYNNLPDESKESAESILLNDIVPLYKKHNLTLSSEAT